MKWFAVFRRSPASPDQRKRSLINYDIRIAATRILQAEASLGITRADQFPTVNGSAGITNERSAIYPAHHLRHHRHSDELHRRFLGSISPGRQEAARANLLATRYAKDVVETTLISSVASNHFLLRQYHGATALFPDTVKAG